MLSIVSIISRAVIEASERTFSNSNDFVTKRGPMLVTKPYNITFVFGKIELCQNSSYFRENKALPTLHISGTAPSQYGVFLLSQFSRNFAKNGVKSFAFRKNLKTLNCSHSS